MYGLKNLIALVVASVAVAFMAVTAVTAAPAPESPIFKTTIVTRAQSGIAKYTDFNGQTACGSYVSTNNDLVVGVSGSQFDQGQYCNRNVSITALGKTYQGRLVDSCGDGCGANDLLLSEKLFQLFTVLGQGQFDATWQLV